MAVVVTKNVFVHEESPGGAHDTLIERSVGRGVKEVIRGFTLRAEGFTLVKLLTSDDGGTHWDDKCSALLPSEGTLDLTFPAPLEIVGQSNPNPGDGETILTRWKVDYWQPVGKLLAVTVYLTRLTYA